ncbi:MAG: alpha/beta family hydrolase, partial [Aeromonas sobria]
PPAKPDRWRGDVLKQIKVPTLLLQGERDTFGSRAELAEFPFSPNVSVHWLTDGDHGFKPRKVSGVSEQENMQYAADTIKHFVALRG